jgi:hypothetical protein
MLIIYVQFYTKYLYKILCKFVIIKLLSGIYPYLKKVKFKMAVINISIPQELIEKVDNYKKIVKKNRSEFFADAVKSYFTEVEEYIAHKRQIKAIKRLMEIGKQMQKDGVFKEEFDVVEEIRRLRQERTDELLRRAQ